MKVRLSSVYLTPVHEKLIAPLGVTGKKLERKEALLNY